MTTLKIGDRVRVVNSPLHQNLEAEIEVIWQDASRQRPAMFEVSGADETLFDADQLEVVTSPKREPKAGEVWSLHGYVCHVLHGDRVSGLDNGMLYYPETSHAVLKAEGKFLAIDPAAYFKARQ